MPSTRAPICQLASVPARSSSGLPAPSRRCASPSSGVSRKNGRVPDLPQLPGAPTSGCSRGAPTTRTSLVSSPPRHAVREPIASKPPKGSRPATQSRALRSGDRSPGRRGRRRSGRYSRVSWDDEANGPRVYRQVCFLDPAFGDHGIGGSMLTWNVRSACVRSRLAHDVSEKVIEAWATTETRRLRRS